jgi:hypothetical protein
VHLNLTDNFKASQLLLRFKGYERAFHQGVTLNDVENMYPHQ